MQVQPNIPLADQLAKAKPGGLAVEPFLQGAYALNHRVCLEQCSEHHDHVVDVCKLLPNEGSPCRIRGEYIEALLTGKCPKGKFGTKGSAS